MPYKTVEILYGFRWPNTFDTLNEAILEIDGATEGELYEVDDLVGGDEFLTKLADIVVGEWCPTAEGERVNLMSEVKEAADSVADDLIGDTKKKSKKKPVKEKNVAKKETKSNGRGRPSAYTDEQTIKVLKNPEFQADSANDKIFKMLSKSKTIKDYRKARAKAGLKGLGGVLSKFVKDKIVRIS